LLWQHNTNPSYKLASIPRYDDIVRTLGGVCACCWPVTGRRRRGRSQHYCGGLDCWLPLVAFWQHNANAECQRVHDCTRSVPSSGFFSARHVDRRMCCRLGSTVASLSHRASNFVYNTLTETQSVARFVFDSWESFISSPTFALLSLPLCLECCRPNRP